MTVTDHDAELDAFLSHPEDRAAYESARKHAAECVVFVCPRGCCAESIHPTDRWASPVGPSSCPHQGDDVDGIRSTWTRAEEAPDQ